MKITDIKVTPSLGAEHRHWSLLKIFTDEGIVGLGEWTAGGPIEQLKQMLIGRDPTNINRLHYDHLWQMQGRGAGVEIALWDIRGKQLNAPMHELLGGKLRDRIRVYCDCHSGAHWTREDYERRWRETRASGQLDPVYETSAYVSMAKEVVAEGYTAIKFDLDVPNPWKLDTYDRSISRRQHHHIVTTIESLRQTIGPYIDLSIDLHGSFNLADALRICKDVEHLDLLWLEDPIRWEWGNVAALAKICQQTETPICTGEIFYGAKMFRELMEQQACDLLEPDIPHSSGAIEIRTHRRTSRDVPHVDSPPLHAERGYGHGRGAYLRHPAQFPRPRAPLAQHPAVEHHARHQGPNSAGLYRRARRPWLGHRSRRRSHRRRATCRSAAVVLSRSASVNYF